MTTLSEITAKLPMERQRRIKERTKVLMDEEMSLRDLRKAREKAYAQVAGELGIDQEGVSHIEERADLLLSALADCVEAAGGRFRLVAEFPDRPAIALTCIGALDSYDRVEQFTHPPAAARGSATSGG